MISKMKTRPSVCEWDESHAKSGTLEAAMGAEKGEKGSTSHLTLRAASILSIYRSIRSRDSHGFKSYFPNPLCLFFLTYGATCRWHLDATNFGTTSVVSPAHLARTRTHKKKRPEANKTRTYYTISPASDPQSTITLQLLQSG